MMVMQTTRSSKILFCQSYEISNKSFVFYSHSAAPNSIMMVLEGDLGNTEIVKDDKHKLRCLERKIQ